MNASVQVSGAVEVSRPSPCWRPLGLGTWSHNPRWTYRIPSSNGEHIRAPGCTNRHTHSTLMARLTSLLPTPQTYHCHTILLCVFSSSAQIWGFALHLATLCHTGFEQLCLYTCMEGSAKYAALLRQIFSMRPKKNEDLNTIKVFARAPPPPPPPVLLCCGGA